MAQEYTIKSVKKRDEYRTAYGTFQSYALILAGVGEPVKMSKAVPVMTEPQEGDTLFGQLQECRTADGEKTYYEFKPEKVKTTTDDRIRAQWAINQAAQVYMHGNDPSAEAYDNIKREAIHFYKMVDDVIEGGNQ